MKELSKFQMAAVKRTAQSVKSLRTKKAKLEEKQAKLTDEINELDEMIMVWEKPVIKMTGGYTSEQILKGESEIKVEDDGKLPFVDDTVLDEYPVTNEPESLTSADLIEADSEMPFMN